VGSVRNALPCIPVCKNVNFTTHRAVVCMNKGFRRGLNDVFAVLRYYTAWNGSYLPTFRDKHVIPIFKGQAVQEYDMI
jgi:hypothetical protein